MEHECIIGMYNYYENTDLITCSELINKNKRDWSLYKTAYTWLSPPTPLEDFFNKRKNTELTRFNYCPVCGKKIDWNKLKRRYKDNA